MQTQIQDRSRYTKIVKTIYNIDHQVENTYDLLFKS